MTQYFISLNSDGSNAVSDNYEASTDLKARDIARALINSTPNGDREGTVMAYGNHYLWALDGGASSEPRLVINIQTNDPAKEPGAVDDTPPPSKDAPTPTPEPIDWPGVALTILGLGIAGVILWFVWKHREGITHVAETVVMAPVKVVETVAEKV
jgi:hypothetical protein